MHELHFIQMRRLARLVGCAVLAGGMLAGCHSSARIGADREYPTAKDNGASADIQVTRDVTTISFTNTTAQNLPEGAIWANSAFSRDFPGLEVGKSITLSLTEFHNRNGEQFRAGGFFSTERPDLLVRVQIEGETELIGLTVIAADAY